MNVVTKIRLLNELNAKELRLGVAGTKSSWHNQYKDSAWVYVGSLPYELSEGDVICVLSQFGEVVNINMIRDKKTGKSKGFAFVCYEDQRSTILAVDNLNGTKIKGRQIRVDHIMDYKVPKEDEEIDELTMKIRDKGVAPHVMKDYEPEVDKVEVKEEVLEEIIISDSDEATKVKKKKNKKGKKKKGLDFLKETPNEKLKKPQGKKSQDSDDEENSQKVKKHKHKRSHEVLDEEEKPGKHSKNRDLSKHRGDGKLSDDKNPKQQYHENRKREYEDETRKRHRRHDDRRERDMDRDRKQRRRRSRSR